MLSTRNLVILGALMAALQTTLTSAENFTSLSGRNLEAAGADASASAQAVAQAISDVPQGGWVPGQNCIAASGDAYASASAKGERIKLLSSSIHSLSNLSSLFTYDPSGRHFQRWKCCRVV